MFHKLSPIFTRRNRWLATLAKSHRTLFSALSTLLYFAAVIPVIILINRQTPPIWAIAIGLLSAATVITVWTTGSHRGIVILRRSSEPSPLSKNLLQKIPLMVMTSVLTFLLTLLGFYLKHKYWP